MENWVFFIGLLLFSSASADTQEGCTKLAYKVMVPRYPPEAVALRAEGKALVLVAVGGDGVPSDATIQTSSGNLALDDAALEAVRSWRFEPVRCNGKAVSTAALLPVDFSLADSFASPILSVSADDQAMEFADVDGAVKYLSSRPDVVEMSGGSPAHRVFRSGTDTRVWFVDKASLTGWSTVMRWREVPAKGRRIGRIAFQCSGPKDYCSELQKNALDFFTTHPPPPAPPPADERKPDSE